MMETHANVLQRSDHDGYYDYGTEECYYYNSVGEIVEEYEDWTTYYCDGDYDPYDDQYYTDDYLWLFLEFFRDSLWVLVGWFTTIFGGFIILQIFIWIIGGPNDFWLSAVDVPAIPIKYFEDAAAYYFGTEQFDPSSTQQVQFFVFLAYPYIYNTSMLYSIWNIFTMPLAGFMYLFAP